MNNSAAIWLVTIGEPCPSDQESTRLLRTGMLAYYLAEKGHCIVWWNSDFDHHKKEHRLGRHGLIELGPRLQLRLLHGCGYSKHVSLERLRDHRQLASAFLSEAEKLPVPSVIVAGYPAVELADACRHYAMAKGVPYAVDIRDLWPDIFLDLVPSFARPFARLALARYYSMAQRTLGAADAIFAVTDSYLEWGVSKAKRKRGPLDAAIPFAYPRPSGDVSDDAIAFWRDLGVGSDSQLIICFFGTFGRQFDIATVIHAACELSRDANGTPVRFVLCGAGDQLGKYRRAAEGIPQIIFPGWMDAMRIRALMQMSHVGLAPYIPSRNFTGNIPNKIVEYMSAGLPILTCLDGLVSDLIDEEDLGFLYRPGDPASLAEAVRSLSCSRSRFSEMGKRARAKFEADYSGEIVMDRYRRAILELAALEATKLLH